MADLTPQMHGKRLTTADILYYLPDHPLLIQEYMWQTYDIAPEFPRLREFISFWKESIEAPLHSVWVRNTDIITSGKSQNATIELKIE